MAIVTLDETQTGPYFHVEHDAARRLVILRRTKVPYPSLEAMGAAFPRMQAALRPLGATRVLIDMRGGPPARNDAAFEDAGREVRQALTSSFQRAAFLMATAVGVLQATRMAREEHRSPNVFRDEAEALAFLLAE